MNTALEFAQRARAAGTTASPRFDLYGTIHKALRSFMGATLQRIGRMDASDAADMAATLSELDALLNLCHSHIRHEDDFVHPAIEARWPAAAARTAADHREHVDSIEALRAEAHALREADEADAAARGVRA